MKKILTILLSVLMVATLGVVNVSAQDEEPLQVGTTATTKIEYTNNKGVEVVLTTSEKGSTEVASYSVSGTNCTVSNNKDVTVASGTTATIYVTVKGEELLKDTYTPYYVELKDGDTVVHTITITKIEPKKALAETDYVAPTIDKDALKAWKAVSGIEEDTVEVVYDGTTHNVFKEGSVADTDSYKMSYNLTGQSKYYESVSGIKDPEAYTLYWHISPIENKNLSSKQGYVKTKVKVNKAELSNVVTNAVSGLVYTGENVLVNGLLGAYVTDEAWTSVEYAVSTTSATEGFGKYKELTTAGITGVTSGTQNWVKFRFHNVDADKIIIDGDDFENTDNYDLVTTKLGIQITVTPVKTWSLVAPTSYTAGTTAPVFYLKGINGETYKANTMTYAVADGRIGESAVHSLTDGQTFTATGTWYKASLSGYDFYKNTAGLTASGSGYTVTLTYTVNGSEALMYRLYNTTNGAHLFTLSKAQKNAYVKDGWKYEGTSWTSPAAGTEVYGLVNPNTKENFYTTSAKEYADVKAAGWEDTTGFYASAVQTESTPWAVYRLFNPNSTTVGSHMFTTSAKEMNELLDAGWKFEGIAFYVAHNGEAVDWTK